MNFVPFTIALLSIYKTYKNLYSKEIGILISFFYTLMPWHHGLDHATSLFSLQLDSIYINTLTPTILLLAVYANNEEKKKNPNIRMGIFMGLTIWSRANSIIALLILIFIFVTYKLKYTLHNVLSFLRLHKTSIIIFIFMALYYYLRFYKTFFNYYEGLNNYVHFNKNLFLNDLIRIPSIFIYGIHCKQFLLMKSTTLFSYAYIIVESAIALLEIKKGKKIATNKSIIFSSLSFFAIYFFYIYRFHSLNLWQGYIIIVAPLFVFLSLVLAKKLSKFKINYRHIYVSFIFVILVTLLYNKYENTPPLKSDEISIDKQFNPEKLRRFSNEIEKKFPKKKIASFYYGEYFNIPLLNYYRLLGGKNELSSGNTDNDYIYINEYSKEAWSLTRSDTNETTKKFIHKAFNEANYLILANSKECYDGYADPTYSLYSNSIYIYKNLNENVKNFFIMQSFYSGRCLIDIWERKN